MRVVTWNVNSIRTRHPHLLRLLDTHEPDVVALQETKCTDAAFAELAGDYVGRGYAWVHHGVDHYNGVALLSRVGLDDAHVGFSGTNRAPFDEARLVSARCGGYGVMSVYVPNGREVGDPHYLFKLVWLERLRAELRAEQPEIVLGDFNVAPADIDIYAPNRWRNRNLASAPERAAIAALVDEGYVDVTRRHHPEPGFYTWYSYRPGQAENNHGLRIDLALVSDLVAAGVRDVWVDREQRLAERPSDHTPLVIDW